MRSLFWKIFLYFLLIIVLIASAGVALTLLRDQEFPPLAHQGFARRAIAEYGRDAISAYARDGISGVDSYSDRLRRDSGIELTLFDQQGRPLSNNLVPRRMMHMVGRALRSGEVVRPMMGNRNAVAGMVRGPEGRRYIVAVSLPDRPRPRDLVQGMTHGFLGWQLLVLLAVTAVVCYLLARSLTSPIKRLREATCRFADGDLSTRIGEQVKGGHELAGLARDFDDMAAKIEDLVASQQRLLRDISHELRSPLARLGIALELARQQQSEGKQGALNRIELEAQRMNEMIGQLLSLTRLENDTRSIPMASMNLAALLEGLVLDADFEAAAKNSRVRYDGPDELCWTGNQELLGRAFENVIRNAVRHTAEDSSVQVSLHQQGELVRIEVLDDGPGVPEEALGKLFTPFYRVEDDRDRKSGGSGIGLAIADRAIRLHGGSIRAENRCGGGLRIEILLPLGE